MDYGIEHRQGYSHEFGKKVHTASMTRGKLMTLGKIEKVLVIGKDLYGVGRSKEDMMPHAKCFDNGKEFVIIDGIISLCC
jgi:hypothetical protein